jgi:hypothetical protein
MFKQVVDGIHKHAEPMFYLVAGVSIVVGGVWALLTFEFQEWLKPADFEPSVMASGTLQKLGEDHSFMLLGYRCTIRNTGPVNAAIVAVAVTANGYRYAKLDTPRGERDLPQNNYRRYGRDDNVTPLFRKVQLTGFATGGDQSGLDLARGESYPIVGAFLVKKNTYDAVTLYVSLGYVKDASPGSEPTDVRFLYPKDLPNVVRFFGKFDPKYVPVETQVDQITP